MKDLLTKKWAVSYEPADNVHHCSAIATRSLVQKKADPGAFTIPCTVGSLKFAKALYDLDFVILDCEVDSKVPIILGRPFLATGSVLIDMRANELLFRLNDEVVRFDICKPMKHPSNMNVFSVADEDTKEISVEKQLTVEPLSAALLNVEHEDDGDYKETMCALKEIGSYSHAPKKLDLDLTNQPSQTAKTSIVEPPMLESKDLPNYLRHRTRLGLGKTRPRTRQGPYYGLRSRNLVCHSIGAAHAQVQWHQKTRKATTSQKGQKRGRKEQGKSSVLQIPRHTLGIKWGTYEELLRMTTLMMIPMQGGTYVEGIKQKVVLSPGHALSFIVAGDEHHHVSSNNFNLLSSRSHTIFTLNLIDLAGSESSKT
ncbi:hypothetical protein CQW23_28537 [Capsicum baccatum]|uniref:Kinesin motor domain-containing protein n=1 Tax=Capsicum baccatum TaxID=33114 RepID=A0A2G2VGT1_CAPBA|nr:hypothetical protein CQW23_28537 [Capsicum baccatum]